MEELLAHVVLEPFIMATSVGHCGLWRLSEILRICVKTEDPTRGKFDQVKDADIEVNRSQILSIMLRVVKCSN